VAERALALRRHRALPRIGGVQLAVASAVLLCALAAGLCAVSPTSVRYVFALLVALNLGVVGMVRPRAGVMLTLLFLAVLGTVRRLLIPAAGWTAFDPLLLVGPMVALLLLGRSLFAGTLAAPDLLSRLLLALVGLTVLEVLNPAGSGVVANAIGLLFAAAPLLWFFAGQAIADRPLVARLLPGLAVVAGLVAAYGLVQTWFGLPSWDQQWVAVTGYASLRVGQTVRAFGTFPSAAEYAAFLGAGAVVSLAWVTRRRLAVLLLVPLLAVALFLESSRGILLFTGFAVLVAASLRTGRGRRAWAVLLTTLVVVLVAGRFAAPAAESADTGGNALVAHQLQGLADPLNPDKSTLVLHWSLIVQGMADSLRTPLGLGPAATNLAGSRVAGAAGSSGAEVDVVNEFTGIGVLGGVLLLAVVAVTLSRAARLALRLRDPVYVALAGVLIVTLGQWLNGGFYAMSALVWLLAGAANRAFLQNREERRACAG
jgi:hypothetical protein